jgi:hypothetical protein
MENNIISVEACQGNKVFKYSKLSQDQQDPSLQIPELGSFFIIKTTIHFFG